MPAEHRVERVRCARCLDVVWTSDPWERVTCRCGAVTVSGLPWRLRVDWDAATPGGWSFVDEASCAELGEVGDRGGVGDRDGG